MMKHLKGILVGELTRHFGDDVRRIEHALQVLEHAEALLADTPSADRETVIAAAILHDFGIKTAEEIHGSSEGKLQEQYGPELAAEVLDRIDFPHDKRQAVCHIIARHHSPPRDMTLEMHLLVESDCLVNVQNLPQYVNDPHRLDDFIRKNFRTPAGRRRAREWLLRDDPVFSHMAPAYELLSDDTKRRNIEGPFLFELAEEAQVAGENVEQARMNTLVLDLACGTGTHARLLGQAGYSVLALDASPSMLAQARRHKATERITYRCHDLRKPLSADKEGSLTLIIGNTLSLFESTDELRQVLRNAAAATRAGGLVVCQILNYNRLRQMGSTCLTRHGSVRDYETVVTKSLQMTQDDRVLLTLTLSQIESDMKWHSYSRSTLLTPFSSAQVVNECRAAGLLEERRYGSLGKERFNDSQSPDYVGVFRRRSK